MAVAVAAVIAAGCGKDDFIPEGPDTAHDEALPDGGGSGGESSGNGTPGSNGGGADAKADGGHPCLDTRSDSYNCGTCGHTCGGGTCTNGVCQAYGLTNAPNPAQIIASNGDLFFAAIGTVGAHPPPGYLGKIAGADGSRVQLDKDLSAGNEGGTPGTLAVDASSVYWVTFGQVHRVARDGSSMTVLATGQFDAENKAAYGIAVDAQYLYWALEGTGTGDGSIMRVPLGGGTAQPLVTGVSPYALAVDATSIYFLERGPLQDGSRTGRVMAMPLGGGTAQPLSTGQINLRSIAVDTTNVYFTKDGAVAKVPIGGGATTPLAASGQVYGLAIDATNAYFAAPNFGSQPAAGSAAYVPLAGGPPVVLNRGTPSTSPYWVAADATAFYWTDYLGSKIWKLAR